MIKKVLITIILLSFCAYFNVKAQESESSFPNKNYFVSFTKVDLFNETNGLSDKIQFSIRKTRKLSGNLYGSGGLNSIFPSNFEWGMFVSSFYLFDITDKLFVYPSLIWETQSKGYKFYLNIGGGINYLIDSKSNLFDSYIIGLDFRYPLKIYEDKNINHRNIYNNGLPVLELKFGIGL